MANKRKTGLGRGLDSLIPVLPDEDESEENSSVTLEDMLEGDEDEKEDQDSKVSKKKSSTSKSKKVANSSKKSKDTKKESKELDTPPKEIATEKPSSSKSKDEKIETKSQTETSKTNEETHQSETEKTSDAKDTKTSNEVSETVANNEEVSEVAKATDNKSNDPQESKNTVEEIRENLTEREKQSIDEVIKIIGKNPRITLWSAKSAAVFRYLRKTEPEFSISKEASKLIDEAVQSKYPEIWTLFEDLEK